MQEMISIIIPMYNVSEYIEMCLESILVQSYSHIEIILIDDGSTDETGEKCKKYITQDPRVIYIKQDNGGSVKARKTGLKTARGDYVVFVDADDYIEADLVEKMYTYISKYGVDFVHANCIENGINNKLINHEQIIRDLSEETKKNIILKNVFGLGRNIDDNIIEPSIHAKIFRLDFIKKCFMPLDDNQQYGEDLLCLCNLIINCNSMMLVPEAYYYYRIREESLSHSRDLYSTIKNILDLNNCILKRFQFDIGDDAVFIKELEKSLVSRVVHVIRSYYAGIIEHEKKYKIGSIDKLRGKKVIIYGAGKTGEAVYRLLSLYDDIFILSWMDKNSIGKKRDFRNVDPFNIDKCNDCDYIIVGIDSRSLSAEVKDELVAKGISEKKILTDVIVEGEVFMIPC